MRADARAGPRERPGRSLAGVSGRGGVWYGGRWGMTGALGLAVAVGVLAACAGCAASGTAPRQVSRDERAALREEAAGLFYAGYDAYMTHAFPFDELDPVRCEGVDTYGGYALTLVDALDTLAVLGDRAEFQKQVVWVAENLRVDADVNVSVFETNIRVVGGLLSAHCLASDPRSPVRTPEVGGRLLDLAEDVAERLLPAFETATGIPYGTVNLRRGVPPGETSVTSVACGGTLLMEMGLLSALTGNGTYYAAAKRSLKGIWDRRSAIGLVGMHIDIETGAWTQSDSGMGTSVDSFYESLIKSWILLDDAEALHIFNAAYGAAMRHLHRPPWYVDVNMDTGALSWSLFNSLQAFWPGMQSLLGDLDVAERTHAAMARVWAQYGALPELYDVTVGAAVEGHAAYPLRPELIESAYYLERATGDPLYLALGRDAVQSLRGMLLGNHGLRMDDGSEISGCGIAGLESVLEGGRLHRMDSYYLSETVKYLYLLLDDENGPSAWISGSRGRDYVFNTEGHMLPLLADPVFVPIVAEHAWLLGNNDVSPSRHGVHLREYLCGASSGDGSGVADLEPLYRVRPCKEMSVRREEAPEASELEKLLGHASCPHYQRDASEVRASEDRRLSVALGV